jgi:hypothetical protein
MSVMQGPSAHASDDATPGRSTREAGTRTVLESSRIATIESARGRGYGTAMTVRIMDDGAAGGGDVAILQTTDMGKPIHERLGFRTVVEYTGYVDSRERRAGWRCI